MILQWPVAGSACQVYLPAVVEALGAEWRWALSGYSNPLVLLPSSEEHWAGMDDGSCAVRPSIPHGFEVRP